MAHLAVTVALLFLACVHAAPAPEPSNPKFTLVKNSSLGLGVANQNGNARGLVNSNNGLDTPVEAPVDTGNNVPDVNVLDNVNVASAFATTGGSATGIENNNKFAKDRTKGSFPFIGYK